MWSHLLRYFKQLLFWLETIIQSALYKFKYTFTLQWQVILCKMNSLVFGILNVRRGGKNPTEWYITYLKYVTTVMFALVILNKSYIQKRLCDSCNIKLSKNVSQNPWEHFMEHESQHWDNLWYFKNLSQCLYSSKIQRLSVTNNYTCMMVCSRVLENVQSCVIFASVKHVDAEDSNTGNK